MCAGRGEEAVWAIYQDTSSIRDKVAVEFDEFWVDSMEHHPSSSSSHPLKCVKINYGIQFLLEDWRSNFDSKDVLKNHEKSSLWRVWKKLLQKCFCKEFVKLFKERHQGVYRQGRESRRKVAEFIVEVGDFWLFIGPTFLVLFFFCKIIKIF